MRLPFADKLRSWLDYQSFAVQENVSVLLPLVMKGWTLRMAGNQALEIQLGAVI